MTTPHPASCVARRARDAQYDLPPNVSLSEFYTLPKELPPGQVAFIIAIENTYELYDEVTTYARVVAPVPPADEESDAYDTWLHTHVIALTGVGHTDGDSWYDIEVLCTSDPEVIPVGKTWDWGY